MRYYDFMMTNANIVKPEKTFENLALYFWENRFFLPFFAKNHTGQEKAAFELKVAQITTITACKEESEEEKGRNATALCLRLNCFPASSEHQTPKESNTKHYKANRIPPIYTKHTPSFLLKKYSRLHLKHKLSELRTNVPLIRPAEYVSAMTKGKQKLVNVHG